MDNRVADDVTVEAIARAMFCELARDEVSWCSLNDTTKSAFVAMAKAACAVIATSEAERVSFTPNGGNRYYSTDGGYPLEVQHWPERHVRIVPRWQHNGIGGPILSPSSAVAMGRELIRISEGGYTRWSWIAALREAGSVVPRLSLGRD